MKLFTKRNMKQFSIKFRLYFLVLLLSIIMLCLFLTLALNELQRNFTALSVQAYQTAESYLTSMEYVINSLKNTSFFPINYALYNDRSILKPLRNNTFSDDFFYKNYLYNLCTTHLKDAAADFMIIYDLNGNGIGIDTLGFTYRDCFIRGEPDWYTRISDSLLGETHLYGPDTFAQSGLTPIDNNSVCAVRSMADPLTWKVIGVTVAGINLQTLHNSFYQIMSFEHQEVGVYVDNTLLFGIGSWNDIPLKLDSQRDYRIQFYSNGFFLENYVTHANDISVIVRTPLNIFFNSYSTLPLFIVVIILILFLWIIWRLIQDTLNSLQIIVHACSDFSSDTIPVLPTAALPPELQEVLDSFNVMANRINALINDVLKKNLEKQDTELQLLRTQINPHYLYNTLEIMHMTAYMKQDYKVAMMAEYLGKNLQYGLRNSTQEVTLREELEQLDIYFSLINYQYRDRLKIHIHISKSLYECKVLKLIFQPIIENCLFHGFSSSNQILSIDILGYSKYDTLCFSISDDGIGINKDSLRKIQEDLKKNTPNRIGIYNVNRRIQLSYGFEYGLSIASIENQGTVVNISLPFKTEGTEMQNK